MAREMRQVMNRLEGMGCTVTYSGAGHYRIFLPHAPEGRRLYFCPSTPKGRQSIKNLRSDLKKLGYEL